jgi:DNA polymerase
MTTSPKDAQELVAISKAVRGALKRSPHRPTLGEEGLAALKALESGPEPPAGGGAESLARLRAELGDCRRCQLSHGRTNLVFGVGDPRARLMFVGEGPGRDEDLQGEPFVGRAGEMLTRAIEAMGLTRQQVYIANVVKCRPPQNRNPEPDEAAVCLPFLRGQIRAVAPRVICLLGAVAAKFVLGDNQIAITKLRGHWQELEGIRVMPTYHPAYCLRNPPSKRDLWADLLLICDYLGLTPKKGAAGGGR